MPKIVISEPFEPKLYFTRSRRNVNGGESSVKLEEDPSKSQLNDSSLPTRKTDNSHKLGGNIKKFVINSQLEKHY